MAAQARSLGSSMGQQHTCAYHTSHVDTVPHTVQHISLIHLLTRVHGMRREWHTTARSITNGLQSLESASCCCNYYSSGHEHLQR